MTTLYDLNNTLFEALERLNDTSLSGDNLKQEIERSRAITGVANSIISNASIALKACDLKDKALDADMQLPRMLKA